MSAEKIASLTKYVQAQKDRLASKNFTKRDTSAFLKIDIAKTERQIEKLKMDGAPAQAAKK